MMLFPSDVRELCPFHKLHFSSIWFLWIGVIFHTHIFRCSIFLPIFIIPIRGCCERYYMGFGVLSIPTYFSNCPSSHVPLYLPPCPTDSFGPGAVSFHSLQPVHPYFEVFEWGTDCVWSPIILRFRVNYRQWEDPGSHIIFDTSCSDEIRDNPWIKQSEHVDSLSTVWCGKMNSFLRWPIVFW